jgi:PadR family transcriptional regulator PadR
MRKTQSTVKVAVALLAKPRDRHWGYDLSKESGVMSGVLYPILARMLDEGWLADGWEDPPEAAGRPPRRYYTITPLGLTRLGALIAEAQHDRRGRFTWMNARAAHG